MPKYIGITLPQDLVNTIERGRTVAILSTFSMKGIPNTAPLIYVYYHGEEALLIAVATDSCTYENLIWQKRVCICFLDKGNVAYSVEGKAGVIRAPSASHPYIHILRVDVTNIKVDKSVFVSVKRGVEWDYCSIQGEEISLSIMDELREVAEEL